MNPKDLWRERFKEIFEKEYEENKSFDYEKMKKSYEFMLNPYGEFVSPKTVEEQLEEDLEEALTEELAYLKEFLTKEEYEKVFEEEFEFRKKDLFLI
jgi:hypothetical protein